MIFTFTDYKRFLKSFIKKLPRNGHGEAGRLAKSLGTNSTFISQVLNGSANLSAEQAYKLTIHFAFNPIETEYFMNLVSMNRAGDKATEAYFLNQLEKIRNQHSEIQNRLNLKSDLSEEDYATYYSHWYYSAVWLLTAIDEFQTKESIAQRLNLPLARITSVLDFLIQAKLVKNQNGKFIIDGTYIHVGKNSIHLRRHHLNWRQQSINQLEKSELNTESASELHYTSPIVVSKKDAAQIREVLMETLEKFRSISVPSECEELYCLNMDWFKV